MRKILLVILCGVSLLGIAGCGKSDEKLDNQKINSNDKITTKYIDYELLGNTQETFSSFSDGLVAVKKDNKVGFIDKNGKLVIDFNYSNAFDFSEGRSVVINDNNKCGVIDTKGNVIVDYIYDFIYPFSKNGLAAVVKDNKIGFINKSGKLVIDFTYDHYYSSTRDVSEDLIAVSKNDKWGILIRMVKL